MSAHPAQAPWRGAPHPGPLPRGEGEAVGCLEWNLARLDGEEPGERERPEGLPVIGAPRELADDLDLAANDEAYARTLRRVRAASESRPEFVPVAVEMRRLRKDLDLVRRENRKLKHELKLERTPVRRGKWGTERVLNRS